jgi:putative hydrolase
MATVVIERPLTRGGTGKARAYDALVSDHGPFGPEDDPLEPLRGMPFLRDIVRLLQSQSAAEGPIAWQAAEQFALSIVTGGTGEDNVDPSDRMGLEQIARVADLHVASATGLRTSTTGSGPQVTAVTRTQWTRETLRAYRPLFEHMAGSLPGNVADQPSADTPDPGDPTAFLAPLIEMMAPTMAGMMAGSMVGNLGQRALGPYTLPIPRAGDEIGIVLANIETFGHEWSLPADDLRLWVCLHEVAHHALLAVPHVRARMRELLEGYLSGFEADPGALERQFGALDPTTFDPTTGTAELFGDPLALLGKIQTPHQRELRIQLDALVSLVVGVVDHVIERVGRPLLTSYGPLTEALHRRRVLADPADRFVQELFGLELSQATYDRGQAFVTGVIERADEDVLARIWANERELPTPAEIDAPGLWLARIDLPA